MHASPARLGTRVRVEELAPLADATRLYVRNERRCDPTPTAQRVRLLTTFEAGAMDP